MGGEIEVKTQSGKWGVLRRRKRRGVGVGGGGGGEGANERHYHTSSVSGTDTGCKNRPQNKLLLNIHSSLCGYLCSTDVRVGVRVNIRQFSERFVRISPNKEHLPTIAAAVKSHKAVY